jgi:hypothetical protein
VAPSSAENHHHGSKSCSGTQVASIYYSLVVAGLNVFRCTKYYRRDGRALSWPLFPEVLQLRPPGDPPLAVAAIAELLVPRRSAQGDRERVRPSRTPDQSRLLRRMARLRRLCTSLRHPCAPRRERSGLSSKTSPPVACSGARWDPQVNALI